MVDSAGMSPICETRDQPLQPLTSAVAASRARRRTLRRDGFDALGIALLLARGGAGGGNRARGSDRRGDREGDRAGAADGGVERLAGTGVADADRLAPDAVLQGLGLGGQHQPGGLQDDGDEVTAMDDDRRLDVAGAD